MNRTTTKNIAQRAKHYRLSKGGERYLRTQLECLSHRERGAALAGVEFFERAAREYRQAVPSRHMGRSA